MKIDTYIHGSSNDSALWMALGPFLVNREVVAELGGIPIYSVPGMHWFIAREGDRVVGFAAMRLTPKAVWYDYGYVVPGRRGAGVFTALAHARDIEASHTRTPRCAVIRVERLKHYKARGWKVTSVRGAWRHIAKDAP